MRDVRQQLERPRAELKHLLALLVELGSLAVHGSDFCRAVLRQRCWRLAFATPAMLGIKEVEKSQLAVLSQGEVFSVTADEQPARLILVAGKPLREPVVKYGPFVMNTAEEIHQAIADFQAGRL